MREFLRGRGADLLLEGIVVIVSILVAFGLDAWWGNRSARIDLLDDLASVTSEVEANIEALQVEALFHSMAAASIDDLVSRIDLAGGAPWLTLPDTIASFAFVFPPVFDASTGALDALVADGSLSRLEDRRLRQLLGDLRAQFEDVRDSEMGARRVAAEEIMPLFWESPDLAASLGRSGEFRRRGLEQTPLPSHAIRLENPPGLKNRLLLRRAWVTASSEGVAELLATLDEARALLERELADGL